MSKPLVTDLEDGRILITSNSHPHVSIWISECEDMLRISTPDPVIWDEYTGLGGHKGYVVYPKPNEEPDVESKL